MKEGDKVMLLGWLDGRGVFLTDWGYSIETSDGLIGLGRKGEAILVLDAIYEALEGAATYKGPQVKQKDVNDFLDIMANALRAALHSLGWRPKKEKP